MLPYVAVSVTQLRSGIAADTRKGESTKARRLVQLNGSGEWMDGWLDRWMVGWLAVYTVAPACGLFHYTLCGWYTYTYTYIRRMGWASSQSTASDCAPLVHNRGGMRWQWLGQRRYILHINGHERLAGSARTSGEREPRKHRRDMLVESGWYMKRQLLIRL